MSWCGCGCGGGGRAIHGQQIQFRKVNWTVQIFLFLYVLFSMEILHKHIRWKTKAKNNISVSAISHWAGIPSKACDR